MLEQFHRYISENARFSAKYVPYYVKWVAECHQQTHSHGDGKEPRRLAGKAS